jgi:polyferredoxin
MMRQVDDNFTTNSSLSRIFSPTALLYAFVVITQIGVGIYVVTDGDAPPSFTFAGRLGFVWIVGWWLRRDSQRRGFTWVYDMGMFLYVLWPFIMSYYLIKTRAIRGLLIVLGFVVAYVGAYLFAALATTFILAMR